MRGRRRNRLVWNGALVARDIAILGLSQAQVAKRAGRRVTEATVSRLVNGDYVSAPLAARVFKVLGQPTERYLLDVTRDDDPPVSPFVQQSSDDLPALSKSA